MNGGVWIWGHAHACGRCAGVGVVEGGCTIRLEWVCRLALQVALRCVLCRRTSGCRRGVALEQRVEQEK